ncbi:hypothetical protein ATOP_18460 [Granulimonas faecalis]|uniref:Uncharacterized protein n=1 Tax=Granulimonas faecalis TaxID=2894155 RepID=A0AAV5B7G0_9ACTN|nr:hypothetical protein ATOP_18460 [Granulimonas faecalis]
MVEEPQAPKPWPGDLQDPYPGRKTYPPKPTHWTPRDTPEIASNRPPRNLDFGRDPTTGLGEAPQVDRGRARRAYRATAKALRATEEDRTAGKGPTNLRLDITTGSRDPHHGGPHLDGDARCEATKDARTV